MKISFIVPGRNNLKYFKWSYDSIMKNKGNGVGGLRVALASDL
jgi:hypothetical protein